MIFARRRLQVMLDEMAKLLPAEKSRDLVARLNHKKSVDQALPAEWELALLWAVGTLGRLEVEPQWWADSRRPDVVTDALIPGKATAIEIAAVSDNAIAGEEEMDAIAAQICAAADRAEKRAGSYLLFHFGSESGYAEGRYFRRRLAPRGYKLSEDHQIATQSWVRSVDSRRTRLRLVGEGLEVEVERSDHKQIRYHNLFSTMPPEAHSLEDNPLFELLVRKSRQLRAAAPGTVRILFLADAGSTLLRYVGRGGIEIDLTRRYVAAQQIIQHFLQHRSRTVDAVVTFSPRIETSLFGNQGVVGRATRAWGITFFGTPVLPTPPPALARVAAVLPAPHYEGYQARSLFRQDALSPAQTGQYLAMTIRGNHQENRFSVEFPARMLADLLAGRLSAERFRQQLEGRSGTNIFQVWLDKGMTISGAEMAPRSLDEDDDHLIIHFTDDPAARPFTLPPTSDLI